MRTPDMPLNEILDPEAAEQLVLVQREQSFADALSAFEAQHAGLCHMDAGASRYYFVVSRESTIGTVAQFLGTSALKQLKPLDVARAIIDDRRSSGCKAISVKAAKVDTPNAEHLGLLLRYLRHDVRADYRLALAACNGHPRTIVTMVVTMLGKIPNALGHIAPAFVAHEVTMRGRVNALCSPSETGRIAVVMGLYDNSIEDLLPADAFSLRFVPRISAVRLLFYAWAGSESMLGCRNGFDSPDDVADLFDACACAQRRSEVVAKWKPDDWRREVEQVAALPVEEHVTAQLRRMFDVHMDWRWNGGSSMEDLVVGRVALWPTMRQLHVAGLDGPDSQFEVSLEEYMGPFSLSSPATQQRLRGTRLLLHGRCAVIDYPRQYTSFPFDRSEGAVLGGCLGLGCDVAIRLCHNNPGCEFVLHCEVISHNPEQKRAKMKQPKAKGKKAHEMLVIHWVVKALAMNTRDGGSVLTLVGEGSITDMLTKARAAHGTMPFAS
eukprot:m51a1_g7739 hypothetical protein (494) ;mRNA; f:201247-202999